MRWLLIDQILMCVPGEFAVGVKTFPRSELFFQDHFPGMPIVPGVLQIEMIAQLAGKCIALRHPEILPVLGSVKSAKYYQNINPGEQCTIKVNITKIGKGYATAEGSIEVNGKRVSTASILFGQVERTRLTGSHFDEVVADWQRRNRGEKEAEA